MSHTITGKIYVLGNDIDTDQIIPAQYLNLIPTKPDERQKLGSYALSGLPDGYPPFIEHGKEESKYVAIVAGKNFGCGSSREHAPIALNAAGIKVVIAESYSRIFFRNSINAGLLYPFETPKRLCEKFKTGDDIEIDLEKKVLTHKQSSEVYQLNSLGDAENIIKAGGIFDYVKKFGTK